MFFNKLFSYFKFIRFQTLDYKYKFYQNFLIKRKNKKFIEPYKFLDKYSYSINNVSDKTTENNNNNEMPIWQCWLQGVNDMPNSVKICMESVKKYNADRKIIILTDENIKDYIELPDYIIEKYKKGIIPKAQFSDILRLSILKEFGGVWIDATMYLTGNLPKEIFSSEFFTFVNHDSRYLNKITSIEDLEIICNFENKYVMFPSTWFIAAKKNNFLISCWLEFLLEYWKNEDSLVDYFIMDYCFALLMIHSKKCKQIFMNMPIKYYTSNVWILSRTLNEEFNQKIYNRITSISFIHKLSYKIIPNKKNKNTFYEHIFGK